MDEKEAIKYLERKDKIADSDNMTEAEQEEVKKVMKEGKIYGDPTAEVQW